MTQYRYCYKCSHSDIYVPYSFTFRGVKLKTCRFMKCKECAVRESKEILKKWFDLFCTITGKSISVDWTKFKEIFPCPFTRKSITDEELEVLIMLQDLGILSNHKENGFWYLEGIGKECGPRNNYFVHEKDALQYAEMFYPGKNWEVKELHFLLMGKTK